VLFIASILASNLFLHSPWRRLVFVAFVIPLGIIRNRSRVWVLGELFVRFGPHMIVTAIQHRGGPIFIALSLIPSRLCCSGCAAANIALRACSRPERGMPLIFSVPFAAAALALMLAAASLLRKTPSLASWSFSRGCFCWSSTARAPVWRSAPRHGPIWWAGSASTWWPRRACGHPG
jgi:hypothetical protein